MNNDEGQKSAPRDLTEVRARIDSIDLNIQTWIAVRAHWSQQVVLDNGSLAAAVDYDQTE